MDEEFAFGLIGEKDVVSRFEAEVQSHVPLVGWFDELATRIEVGVPISQVR